MSAPGHLRALIQRQQLLAYEQSLARATYAYGVDLRRGRWLTATAVGQAVSRAVDGQWSRLTHELQQEVVDASPIPAALHEPLSRALHDLGAPTPTIRLVRPGLAAAWPLVTPLAPASGLGPWLLLDHTALTAERPSARRFWLGWGLGHLACEHRSYFAAHLAAYRRGRGLALVRAAFAAWTRVGTFSADRAGLLCARSLVDALACIHRTEQAPWWPRTPPVGRRTQALTDFDRSEVAIEGRVVEAAAESPQDPWSLARCDQRLTERLGIP